MAIALPLAVCARDVRCMHGLKRLIKRVFSEESNLFAGHQGDTIRTGDFLLSNQRCSDNNENTIFGSIAEILREVQF